MIPKSGHHFSDNIMLRQRLMIPKSMPRNRIRGGNRFSDKIMLRQKLMISKGMIPLRQRWRAMILPDCALLHPGYGNAASVARMERKRNAGEG